LGESSALAKWGAKPHRKSDMPAKSPKNRLVMMGTLTLAHRFAF
jgi:hypothetical protein